MRRVLDTQQWLERLQARPRPNGENVVAFYEHGMGLCRDAHMLLAPLDDHLVHRGDGVFESINFRGGKIYQLPAHLARLKDSSAALKLSPPCSWEEIADIILDVAKAGQCPDGSIKLLLGRGMGGFGIDPKECPQASLYVVASRARPLPPSFWEKGLRAARSAIAAKPAYLAQIKSTNYLPNVFMAQEARALGVDLTFSFDPEGFLAEAAIANVAIINPAGQLLMPHFRFALPGTTALKAMELAKQSREVIITHITEDTIYAASEVLVLGSSAWCVGVTHYQGQPIGTGQPGPVARQLCQNLQQVLHAEGLPFLEL